MKIFRLSLVHILCNTPARKCKISFLRDRGGWGRCCSEAGTGEWFSRNHKNSSTSWKSRIIQSQTNF